MFKSSLIGIFVTDVDDRCTYTNPTYRQISGQTDEESSGRGWSAAIHPEDRARVSEEWLASVRDQTPHRSEHRFLRKDGTTAWARVRAETILDGSTVTGRLGMVEDITDRKGALDALQASEECFRSILNTAPDPFVAIDGDGLIIDWNPQCERTFGWSRAEAFGRKLEETIIPPRYRDAHIKGIKRFQTSGQGTILNKRVEFSALHRDGHEIPVEMTVIPIRTGTGHTFYAFLQDITDRKLREQNLQEQAAQDTLTGLPNRSILMDRLGQAMARCRWNKRFVAVLYLDLDGFKQINDTRGHAMGDNVLGEVARRLVSCVRDGDTICRLGGDEFVLILVDLAKYQDVPSIARKILTAVALPARLDGQDLKITASLGVSLYPEDGGFPETLVKKADAAMYRAKRQGRNCCQFHSPKYKMDGPEPASKA